MSDLLISADQLATRLDEPGAPRPVILDVRWRLGGPPGHEEYLRGHLPGAVYVDLETDLASPGEPTDGRHPLPDIADLEHAARRWGLNQDTPVVVHDGEGNLAAARAWWLLRWAGLHDVRLLDGALPAWVAAGHPLETGDVVPLPGQVELIAGSMPTLDADDVASFAVSGVLLDARAAERYLGEVEPMDPKAGHVPGAVSAPTTANLTADGRFRPAAELRDRFTAAGVSQRAPVGGRIPGVVATPR